MEMTIFLNGDGEALIEESLRTGPTLMGPSPEHEAAVGAAVKAFLEERGHVVVDLSTTNDAIGPEWDERQVMVTLSVEDDELAAHQLADAFPDVEWIERQVPEGGSLTLFHREHPEEAQA